MSRRRGRAPLSAAAVGLLRTLERSGGSVPAAADLVALVGGSRAWTVLATLHGRMLVRWDDGGSNVRLTRTGRDYLRHNR